MSEAVLHSDPVVTSPDDKPSFLKWKPMFSLLALIGGGGLWAYLMFGAGEMHKYALNSFVFGFIFWLAATLGCLGLLLLHNSINSSWTLSVLRIFEAGSHPIMFGTLAFFFLPVRRNMGLVYEWVHADPKDVVLQFKAPYLNLAGFDYRCIAFLIVLGGLSWYLQNSSKRQDSSKDPNEAQKRTNVGTPGLVIFASVITFLLTDIAMSLTPHWYSTIYPLWLVIGGCQTALSLAIILVCSNAEKQPYKDSMSPSLTKDLGNMMFLLTMLWGYTSVSQLIILWNGNLPETAVFYAHRGSDAKLGWNFVGASTILGCFVIPFSSLLSTRLKRYAIRVRNVALFIFCFRIVDVFWIIAASIPHRQTNMAIPTGWDIAGLLVMGFVWMAVMLYRLEKTPLLPLYDNRLKEAKANAH